MNIRVTVQRDGATWMVGRVTIPKGKKFTTESTFKNQRESLGLSKAQMLDLCKCPLTKAGFEKLWRETWAQEKQYPYQLDVDPDFWL